MTRTKFTKVKSDQKTTVLDKFLWFVENCLPQKSKRSSREEFNMNKLESNMINRLEELASFRSKSLRSNFSNKKITFTVGNWALPYLDLLKRIGILK